ncbi:MAG: hypothetical protein RL634_92 [Bacteroidota bacterium]
MKNFNLKSLLPHLIAVVSFVLVATIYCKPALQGKVLQQSDNVQWKAMYEDQRKYEEKTGHLPLWSNGMFSGMPGYQIAMYAPNPFSLGYVYNLMTLGLPKPIYFFVLAALCFYILTQILNINPYLGILGGLSYAFATYNPIIISVGHDTKMLAIAYIPALIGSIILLFEKKYLLGTALTALFSGLIISVNHPQIVYYTFIIILCMSVGYLVNWLKEKEYLHIFKVIGLAAIAALLGIASNAVLLGTTYEYSKESIRGGTVLADGKSNFSKTGLNKDYALSYSIYKSEPLVMMFPRLYGGSTGNLEVAEDKSKAIEALQQMPQELAQQLQGFLQFYWGGISAGTAGPPYSGAIICFLAILGMSFIPNKHKWWMIGATMIAFMISWGHYFEGFNVFLLEHLPLFNKFRAPSMILVIPTFIFAMSAVIAAQYLLFQTNATDILKKYKKGMIAVASIFILAMLVYLTSDFKTENDENLIKQVGAIANEQQRNAILPSAKAFVEALQEDRKSLFWGDIFRSLIFILIAAVAIWLYLKNKMKAIWALAIIGLAGLIDLLGIDSKYLNETNFQEQEEYAQTFTPAPYNTEISKDTSYYRVFDITNGVNAAFNGYATPSVFHQNIGGYHAAKLSIYQDLIEKQLYNFPNCGPTLDMLNTKYIIFRDPQSNEVRYEVNPTAAGPCWYVDSVSVVSDPAKLMKNLDGLSIKTTALIESKLDQNISKNAFGDSIWLVKNDHDIIYYSSNSTNTRFAVFSEVYYRKGWKAYIDGKESTIFKTNYVLRGLVVPAGKHEIKFEFKPDSFSKGVPIAMTASGIIWLLLLGNLFMIFRSSKINS